MSSVVLCCSALEPFVQAAQARCGTNFPVVTVDRIYHFEPSDMKNRLVRAVDALPAEVDTVLVAMGFCGGAWDHVTLSRRVVIPRTDDCVSLLLHTDDEYRPNRKEPWHLYIYERDPADFSALGLLRSGKSALEADFGSLDPDFVFHMMTDGYHNMDIIDTGLTDCYSEEYVEAAQREADLIGAALDYVPGSLRLLEKLLTGRWDAQFLVAEPGRLIRHGDFFE